MTIKVCSFGITIGPFSTMESRRMASRLFDMFDRNVFRDLGSIEDAKKLGIKCDNSPIPDIALYDSENIPKEGYVSIIPFNLQILNSNFIDCISKNFNTYKIIVTITQIWNGPISLANELHRRIKENNPNVILKIPKNYTEINQILSKSDIVISQNLHGLIMGYRSGSKIVSLNQGRKFLTFMKFVDLEEFSYDLNERTDILHERIINKQSLGTDLNQQLVFLKEDIRTRFASIGI